MVREFEPMRFRPLLKRYVWGGRRLGECLGKAIGEGTDYAESWEVVDHGDNQSLVTEGASTGMELGDLVRRWPREMLGAAWTGPRIESNSVAMLQQRFPLLFKFLDAQLPLSVQVHPSDQQGLRLNPPDLGKTEAWVILDARPGSLVFAGLRDGVGRDELERHVQAGTTDRCLHSLEPMPGDCLFIPAGTVHALGGGLLVAEIQQASNTTFRLFDWNRVDASGQPRPLHIAQALETIDYQRGPVQPQKPQATGETGRELLVECEKFRLERLRGNGDRTLAQDDRCHILAVIDGSVRVRSATGSWACGRGETLFLPASRPALVAELANEAVLLYMSPNC
jgi:mannose-6-phosphate isomerase